MAKQKRKRGGGVDHTKIPLNQLTRRMFQDHQLKKLAAGGSELAKEELAVRKKEREEFNK